MSKRYGFWTLGVALLVCTSMAQALSLGRARGAVLLGRGLDLTIQTTLDAQEALPEVNCLAADVFYGDVRVSPNTVSVFADRSAAGEPRIRVRSIASIDEPVVTVYLRTTCGASVSRRYVLLADTLTEAETPAVVAPAQLPRLNPSPVDPAPARATNPASSNSSNAAGTSSSSGASAAATERAAQRQARREERARAQRERAQSAQAAERLPVDIAEADAKPSSRSVMRQSNASTVRKSSGPRLQVDLLDLANMEPSLRSSFELTTEPTADAALRSQAQALWRSLNASPEDAMRDAKRLETLEAQMRASLEQSKRQGQDIAALSSQLQESQKARYLNPFTMFLGFLTLLALGLSVWLWRKNSGASSPWYSAGAQREKQDEAHLWSKFEEEEPKRPSVATASVPLVPSTPATQASALETSNQSAADPWPEDKPAFRFAQRSSAPVEFAPRAEPISLSTAKIQPLGTSVPSGRGGSMGRVDSTPPPSLMPPARPSAKSSGKASSGGSGFGHTDFGASGFASSRLAAEELFDIQEQADFFMSLGQPEQAIEVLKNHITDHVETSAVAFMDLFDIYHRTNRSNDYEQLREEFNRVFNAQAPSFNNYGKLSHGLESYPEAIESIQRYWPGPQTLDVIEESIFRQPDAQNQPFDMLAYRELMLLYSLAKILNKPGAVFTPAQPIGPITGISALSNTGLSLLDEVPDSGQMGLPQTQADEMDSLGLDLTFPVSGSLNVAIARDATIALPPLSLQEDNGIDFDLSNYDELKP
jgi:pilus assembly protein FimV